MKLSVAIWMNQQSILCRVRSTQRPIDDVVVVPARYLRNGLFADWAESFLLTLKMRQHSFALQVVLHLNAKALFQIEFPLRVIRVAVSFDFDVSLDGNTRRLVKPVFNSLTFPVFDFSEESPVLVLIGAKVFVFDPSSTFIGMSSSCPSPQGLEDGSVYLNKGFLACGVSMKVRPSPNFRIQACYQIECRNFSVGLDDFTDFIQECFDVSFRRFGQKFATVFADILSEKVKTAFYVCNSGFLFREFQTPFLEKFRDERLHFFFQYFFRNASDDEVIRVSHQIDLFVHASHSPSSCRGILLSKYLFQSIQSHVSKDRRDDSTLRCTIFCVIEGPFVHVSRFQPFSKDDLIRRNVGHKPFVANSVEAGFDIAFKYPLCAVSSGQCITALFHGVCTAPFLAKPIRIGVCEGFRDGFQCQQVQGLHRSVFHRGDTEGAHLPIGLWDVHPSERAWLITASFQLMDGTLFLRRVVPDHAVHPRRVLALVFRHSSYRKCFAAKRVGQQVLQGFHLVPLAVLRCLDDTRLKPTYSFMDLLPIDGMPIFTVGSSTSRGFRRHLHHFLSRFFEFSRHNRPEGSLPAFASGNVEPCIRLITRRPSLSPSSFTRIPIGSLCRVPTSFEERYGLTVFRTVDINGLGALCPPVAVLSMSEKWREPLSRATFPFWARPFSIFGLFRVTTFIKSSHVFTIPSTLAPHRLMLADTLFPHGSSAARMGMGTLSGSFRRRITLPPYPVEYC